jgi:hypothetical protein
MSAVDVEADKGRMLFDFGSGPSPDIRSVSAQSGNVLELATCSTRGRTLPALIQGVLILFG